MSEKPSDTQTQWREQLKIWLPITLLAVIAFGFTLSRLEPPAPRDLRIATGGSTGAYFGSAQGYARYLAEHGFNLEVVETAGSVENLELLRAGEVDLAIAQGGVIDFVSDQERLHSLASLFLEPLWIFHRQDQDIQLLSDLLGKRLAVGGQGSGTQILSLDLLAENGIDQSNTELQPLDAESARQALLGGQVDAAFFVSSPSAGYIDDLLKAQDLTLMPMRRSHAYRVRHPFLSTVTLGEGVIDLDSNLPDQDVPMVAAAAGLFARKELHHALVPLLIEAAESVHGGDNLFQEAGYFPSKRHLELPLKKEASHYLEHGPSFLYRILPYRTATAVDRLKILLLPFIPLLLVAFKVAPPLYRWRIRSKIYRWYEDLRELDLLLLSEPDRSKLDEALATIDRLELEVTEVSVPLSYMDEFYNLRVHMELIEAKLRGLSAAEASQA